MSCDAALADFGKPGFCSQQNEHIFKEGCCESYSKKCADPGNLLCGFFSSNDTIENSPRSLKPDNFKRLDARRM